MLRKSEEELRELRDAGITMVYIGAESGSDAVLEQIHKGETRQQLIDGVRKAEDCGIQASVTFISGIAGGINGLTERLQKILNNLIEGIAVMIVTSCLIPIVVMLFFSWIIKAIVAEAGMSDRMRMPMHMHMGRRE